jgi:hypothetical protein
MALNVQSKILMSQGDEAGSLGGVVSNVIMGPGSFSPATASMKVMLEGKPAVSQGAQTFHNGDAAFNTIGLCSMGGQTTVMVE